MVRPNILIGSGLKLTCICCSSTYRLSVVGLCSGPGHLSFYFILLPGRFNQLPEKVHHARQGEKNPNQNTPGREVENVVDDYSD